MAARARRAAALRRQWLRDTCDEGDDEDDEEDDEEDEDEDEDEDEEGGASLDEARRRRRDDKR